MALPRNPNTSGDTASVQQEPFPSPNTNVGGGASAPSVDVDANNPAPDTSDLAQGARMQQEGVSSNDNPVEGTADPEDGSVPEVEKEINEE